MIRSRHDELARTEGADLTGPDLDARQEALLLSPRTHAIAPRWDGNPCGKPGADLSHHLIALLVDHQDAIESARQLERRARTRKRRQDEVAPPGEPIVVGWMLCPNHG